MALHAPYSPTGVLFITPFSLWTLEPVAPYRPFFDYGGKTNSSLLKRILNCNSIVRPVRLLSHLAESFSHSVCATFPAPPLTFRRPNSSLAQLPRPVLSLSFSIFSPFPGKRCWKVTAPFLYLGIFSVSSKAYLPRGRPVLR